MSAKTPREKFPFTELLLGLEVLLACAWLPLAAILFVLSVIWR
jgi:hypothetical protein